MKMIIKSILGARVAVTKRIVGLSMVMMGSTLAAAEHLTKVTKSYNEVTIGGYARWNDNCDPIESPQIYLDVPPKNGVVCARTSTGTAGTVREGKAGHCAGRPMRGIKLIYLPRSGFTGVDAVQYTVKFAVISQTIDVDLVFSQIKRPQGSFGFRPHRRMIPKRKDLFPYVFPWSLR